nr:hypothetical protein Iba_chr04bCG14710 [Ipomoea batatas]GMC91177.1 hypothetical protein Iba_chr04fCG14900 [Ipomoea batatas]
MTGGGGNVQRTWTTAEDVVRYCKLSPTLVATPQAWVALTDLELRRGELRRRVGPSSDVGFRSATTIENDDKLQMSTS